MPAADAILGAVAGLALGGFVGYVLGKRYRDRSMRVYWLLFAAVFVVGVGLDALGLAVGAQWLAVGGAGIVAGGLTGLKYGRAHIVRLPRDEAGTGAERRAR